ncbi:DNA polymerase I [candidate division KSB1 bacterium]|nr:DNA polymerase I [candidate division KSB1 bacterium]
MSKKRLFLIDGSALAYRAFFAFQRQPLINSKGENTGATFGFYRSLQKIIDDENPDYIATVFDTPEPTFRHELYPDYKATREKMPDEMSEQLPRIKQMLRVMNIELIEISGFEADDVIGTLAAQAEKNNLEVWLVTGDKDFMQLVSENIKIYNPKRASEDPELLDVQGVVKKVGLAPVKIIDYMALTGDSSDNIPGVRGVGPKSALELMRQFSTLEEILANTDKIDRKSLRRKIDENRENASLSKKLVTIDTNVKLDIAFENLKKKDPDKDTAIRFFKELEFTSVLEQFMGDAGNEKVDYQIIDTETGLEQFINRLKESGGFTLDLETTSRDPMMAQIVGLSFSWEKAKAFYVPVSIQINEPGGDLFDQQKTEGIPVDSVINKLKTILEDESIKKCGQNIKYDMLVLANYGCSVEGVDFDTMVASYLINPSLRQHNLDALSLEYLNYQKIATSELLGTGKNQKSMAEVPVKKVAQYACEDADMTQRLRQLLEKKLNDYNLLNLFETVELPLIYVLMEIERNGVSLDVPFLKKMSGELRERLDKLEEQIYEVAGEPFNINSPRQLADVLFNKLKLPVIRRTKTGISTDVNVLEELAKVHILPQDLLEFRQLAKLKSTYVDALPKLVNTATGRVHTSYNQTVAATGRLSSSDPNLQNIPIRTEIGRKIRRAFIPKNDDYILLDADYSQIELRIMAHISQDETLRNSFRNDEDVHRKTAALIFKLAPDKVTDELRRRAKEVNFGIMYGMGAYGLASRLDIAQEEAESFIMDYFAGYPEVKAYIDRTIAEARENGYVTTLMKRRRYLPEINNRNRRVREFAERTAINTPIQGSAADLIKIAMIRISDKIKKMKLDAKMILQVHDELLFEVVKDQVEEMEQMVRHEMENAIELSVPVKVDVGIGSNWLEAH